MDNIIGRDTKLLFDFNPVEIPSKIDTGAETNSIHCKNILLKNGILYCDILDFGEMLPFSNFKTKRVKSSNGIDNERYCVSLPFTLNGNEYTVLNPTARVTVTSFVEVLNPTELIPTPFEFLIGRNVGLVLLIP